MGKIAIVPSKIGNILKRRRVKKLKAISKLKKRMKKKGIHEEIVTSTATYVKTIGDLQLKEIQELEPCPKLKRMPSHTLLNKRLNSMKINELKSTDGNEGNSRHFNSEEQRRGDSSSENWDTDSASDCHDENVSIFDKNAYHSEDSIVTGCYELNDDEKDFSDGSCNIGLVYQRSDDISNKYQIEYMPNKVPNSKINVLRSRKIREAKAEFHHLSGKSYLLILRHPGQLYFRGSLSVTPISGVTSFLGYEFAPGMKPHMVFSPKGISPLYFSTAGHSCKVEEIPKIPGLDKNILKRLGEKDSSLMIEPASGEHWVKLFGFFNRLLKFNPLAPPTRDLRKMETEMNVEDDLGVELLQPSSAVSSKSFHRESLDWDNLSQEIQCFGHDKGQMRVMVFGGKGVGKSTFMRFLVNQWLTSCNKRGQARPKNGTILFIDFDPGQSEFVPPGCLSATLISEPLLGPNYTHLKDPERMICLGELDTSKCPKWYLYCADDLIKFCSSEEFKDLPWFINTMGFCRGIGADLAVELIRLCKPTHVIQLTSIWARRNFEPLNLLSWHSVKAWKGYKWNPEISNENNSNIPEYSYHQLQSLAESTEKAGEARSKVDGLEDIDSQWGIPAWQSREFCILAYFSKVVEAPQFCILDIVPHTFKLSDLVLSLPSEMVKPQYIKAAFDARLVALSSLGNILSEYRKIQETGEVNQTSAQNENDQQRPWLKFLKQAVASDPNVLFHMPLAPCLGFGLVRAVDDSKEEIYVTAPLHNEVMATVDCLATGPNIGSIPTPIMIDSFKESKQEKVPYIMKKDHRTDLSRSAPRVFQAYLANPGAKRVKI